MRGDAQAVSLLGHRIKSAARGVGALACLELLPQGDAASELAHVQPMLAKLKDLLEQVAKHIKLNAASAAQD